MSERLIINGGKPLKGAVKVSGSKNAVLPLLAASLLVEKGETIFQNVPDIADVHSLIFLMENLGAKVEFDTAKNTVKVNAEKLQNKPLEHEMVKKLRASILLLAPLLMRKGKVSLDFPGGCVIGVRSATAHIRAMEKMGAKNECTNKALVFEGKTAPADFTLPEISVTATENALMLAALTPGKTIIRLAAAEPHVQDVCEFLVECGVKINGIGTHTLEVFGKKKLKAVTHSVRGDYLEVGTFAIAAAVTGGELKITGGEPHDLDSFWEKLEEAGVPFEIKGKTVIVGSAKKYNAIEKLDTGVFPKFPTDLQAPFGVLLTQCSGVSRIFETLFEGRLAYLYELEKMGAEVEVSGAHEAFVTGKTALKGASVSSFDLRAGAAMLLAGLAAKGETEVHAINYLDRGYEKIDEKMSKLGADIKRVQ